MSASTLPGGRRVLNNMKRRNDQKLVLYSTLFFCVLFSLFSIVFASTSTSTSTSTSSSYLEVLSELELHTKQANQIHTEAEELLSSLFPSLEINDRLKNKNNNIEEKIENSDANEAANSLLEKDVNSLMGPRPMIDFNIEKEILQPVEHKITTTKSLNPNAAVSIFAEMHATHSGMESPAVTALTISNENNKFYDQPHAPPTYHATFLFDTNAPWRTNGPKGQKTRHSVLKTIPYSPLREAAKDGSFIERTPDQYSPGPYTGPESANYYTPGYLPRNINEPTMYEKGDGPQFKVDRNGNPVPFRPAIKTPIQAYSANFHQKQETKIHAIDTIPEFQSSPAALTEISSTTRVQSRNRARSRSALDIPAVRPEHILASPGPASIHSSFSSSSSSSSQPSIPSLEELKQSLKRSLRRDDIQKVSLIQLNKEKENKRKLQEKINSMRKRSIQQSSTPAPTSLIESKTGLKALDHPNTKKAWWENQKGLEKNQINQKMKTIQKLPKLSSHHSGAYELSGDEMQQSPFDAQQQLDMSAVEMNARLSAQSKTAQRLNSKMKSSSSSSSSLPGSGMPFAKGGMIFNPTTNDDKFMFLPAGMNLSPAPLPDSHPFHKSRIPEWAPESQQPAAGQGYYGSSAAIIPGAEALIPLPGVNGKEYTIRAREAWLQYENDARADPSKQPAFPPYAFVPPYADSAMVGGRPDLFPRGPISPVQIAQSQALATAGLTNQQISTIPNHNFRQITDSVRTLPLVSSNYLQSQSNHIDAIPFAMPTTAYPSFPSNFPYVQNQGLPQTSTRAV